MEHTPAPQKSRELFFSSTQGCVFKKIRFLQKTIHSSTKFTFIWSGMVKNNKIQLRLNAA